jgi:membrane-associated phospholipid phosphatase
VLAMLLLGWAAGKGSTTVDDVFLQDAHDVVGERPSWLLVFTDWWLLGPVLVACLGVALCRRLWRVAAVVAICPFVAIEIDEALKRLFERHNGQYLEYPSGHTALAVAVMGMVVLVTGGRLWAVTAAVAVSLLAMLGEIGCGYHYFTDTVGAVLLATALVCIAARLAGGVHATRGSPLVDAE